MRSKYSASRPTMIDLWWPMMAHLRRVRTVFLRLTRLTRAVAIQQPVRQRSGRLGRLAPRLRGDSYSPRYYDTGEPI
jgi:hypothetical protein